MKKILILINVLFVMLLCFACANGKVLDENEKNVLEKVQNENIENMMDNFSCEINDGSSFELYNRNNDKPVFINFWATWCGPCVGEMPDLQKLYDEYKDKVDFIFVNCGDSKEIIDNFLNTNGNIYTFPIGYDEDNVLTIKFNITGIPATYILDSNNMISDVLVGARSGDEYKEFLNKVLK